MMHKYVLVFVGIGLAACSNQSPTVQQTEAVDTTLSQVMASDKVVEPKPVQANMSAVDRVEAKVEQRAVLEKAAKIKGEHKVEYAKVTTVTTVASPVVKVAVQAVATKVVAPQVQGKQPLRSQPMLQPEPVVMLGDAMKGKKIAKKCMACHTFEKGGRKKTGPNLFAVVGRDKGAASGFKYGTYLKNAPGSWTESDLRAWIKGSKAVAKAAGGKTKMPSQKIKGKKADDLIAYLKTLQ
ncbi:MAG: c-type cytochrome [Ghiorsea sp.]|nr:c-type cytochrome [Ghiorsea sp.]